MERLNGLVDAPTEPIPDRPAPRKVTPRLPHDQVDELVRGYQDGASVYELADRFDIHRGTVSRHLHVRASQGADAGAASSEQASRGRATVGFGGQVTSLVWLLPSRGRRVPLAASGAIEDRIEEGCHEMDGGIEVRDDARHLTSLGGVSPSPHLQVRNREACR